MLSVRGCPRHVLDRFVEQIPGTCIALVNGESPPNLVVSGHPIDLHKLQSLLATIQADAADSQVRVPFSKRKLEFSTSYLPVTAPFHSPLLAAAIPLIRADLARLQITLSAKDLAIPVLSTADGMNLQLDPEVDGPTLLSRLVEMQCIRPVQWAVICRSLLAQPTTTNAPSASQCPFVFPCPITHVLDFGPGGSRGIARLTAQNLEGKGVQVMLACEWRHASDSEDVSGEASAVGNTSDAAPSSAVGALCPRRSIPGLSMLLDTRAERRPIAVDWAKQYGARVSSELGTSSSGGGGKFLLVNKWTEMVGRPPVMVAGMTPSTVGEVFVSAIASAGYVVELAGGGQISESMFRERIVSLTGRLPPGHGITVNLLFLNPRLWAFQFPMSIRMRKEGYPIEALTIAAGVPSLEKGA